MWAAGNRGKTFASLRKFTSIGIKFRLSCGESRLEYWGMTMRGRATRACPPALHACLHRAGESLAAARKRRSQITPPEWLAFLAAASVLLAGCAATTPEDFRQQVTSGAFGSAEKLDVDRSLRDVAAVFRERPSACLQVRTKRYGGPAVRYTMQVWDYTPTVVATDTRVELHLQAKYDGLTLYDQGKNGAYVLLAQATPLDARRTHLEVWTLAPRSDTLRDAVMGWAKGSFAGCPDLS